MTNKNSKFIPTIGLEIHAELGTKTKMFCGCANWSHKTHLTNEQIKPNIFVCPVCLGLPGALPVPNLEAVKMTIMIGRALNCEIAEITKWDRKNYFYPDLPKGYQISQYDEPIATRGQLEIRNQLSEDRKRYGSEKIENRFPTSNVDTNLKHPLTNIEITRIHLEEDTGKLTHPQGGDYSLVDFNRSGVPLVELVTEPIIHSAQEAKTFAQEYQLILRYLGVSDADMERGQMRVEANISIAKDNKGGQGEPMGTKVEVKNLNSFRSVERAIEYEIERQIKLLKSGGNVVQETRGWNDNKQITFPQRSKETSSDYRYFPEPDIPQLKISNIKYQISKLPELPSQKREKLAKIGIKPADIEVLVSDPARMAKFESVGGNQSVATLLVHRPETAKMSTQEIQELAKLPSHLQKAKLSGQEIIQGDTMDLQGIVKGVLKDHQAVVADIKSGKSQAIGVLIGQVMSKTKGQANPGEVKKLLDTML